MKKQGLIAGFALAAAMTAGVAIGGASYMDSYSAGTGTKIKSNDNTGSAAALLHSGNRMPDGTVYAGISPDTRKPLSTTPADAPGTYNWDKSAEYCAALEANGHRDWRVPSKEELNVLFQNRAAIGSFDISGSDHTGWYWSSSQDGEGNAWGRRFSDGTQGYYYETGDLSLRCVR